VKLDLLPKMSKCDEPSCLNQKNEKLIQCSSPFCSRQFHLSCANLKGKTKSEISNLYFLCKSCHDFIQYSNSTIETKLKNLEEDVKQLMQPIEQKLQVITLKLEKSIDEIMARVCVIEKSELVRQKNMDDFKDKIIKLESKLDAELLKFVNKLDNLDNNKPIIQPAQSSKPQNNNSTSMTKYRLRISGICEPSSQLKPLERQAVEETELKKILSFMNLGNVLISDFFRLGKFKAENKRDRTMLVTFQSVWDRRKILSSSYLLKDYEKAVFISPELTAEEKLIERKVLKKRYELIQSGIKRENIKIRNLKLFHDNVEVKIEDE